MCFSKGGILNSGEKAQVHEKTVSESEYFTGDTSIDIHSPGPTIAKTSL